MVAPTDAAPMSGRRCQEHLALHFATSRQAQLLAGLTRERNGHWHENARVFVVHPDWPGAPGL